MPYPYIAGKKVNSRYMKKPIKTKSKGQPAYYKREITEYRHNIPDYKIIFINRKPKLIAYWYWNYWKVGKDQESIKNQI